MTEPKVLRESVAARIREGRTNKDIREEFCLSQSWVSTLGKRLGLKMTRQAPQYGRVYMGNHDARTSHPFRILAALRSSDFATDVEVAAHFHLTRERIGQIRAFASSLGLL